MRSMRNNLSVLALVALPLVGAGPRLAAQDVDVPALYKKVVKSCVFIVTPAEGGFAMGSGSLIDAQRKLVLTNFHVVDEEPMVFVQFPIFLKDGDIDTNKDNYMKRIPAGQAIKGEVLFRDKSRDLALIRLAKVPLGTPAIPLAKKSVQRGETTWNIGNPGAVKQVFSITKGEVRGVGVERHLVGGGDPASVFEIRARMVTATNPTNPGDSGGPLFDKRGYQVAVTESGRPSASLVNFFVDVTEVRAFLNEKKITIKELSDEPDPKPEPKETPIKTPIDNGKTPPKKVETVEKPAGPSAADEENASRLLRRAKLFASGAENRKDFMRKLDEIVKKYPGTVAGKEAKRLLAELK